MMTETPKQDSRRTSFQSSLCSAKRKLAPRSSLQFKIGPQFAPTVIQNVILDSKGEEIKPILTPRIDRGFERIDEEWVGYKRNYFTLVSSFCFEGVSFLRFAADFFHTIDPQTGQRKKINYFGIRLSSKCADDDSSVVLIQHTAKRDRGPQFEPPIHPAVPSNLPDHNIIREAANVRNTSKIAKLNRIFFFDRDDHEIEPSNIKGLQNYPTDKIIKVARYERIQFSSSINYKKPSLNNKRFKLFVELVGFTDIGDWIPLAYTETPPLIVRGRSPSNYQGTESEQFETDNSSQNTPLESLDDFATYQILKMATEDLEFSPSIPFKPKKKRGRKPKPKPDQSETTPLKRTKSITKEPKEQKVSKTPKEPKERKIKVRSSDHLKTPKHKKREVLVKRSDDKNILTQDNSEMTKEPNSREANIQNLGLMLTPSRSAYDENDAQSNDRDNFDFEDSAELVNLFDSQMHYNSVQEKPHFTQLLSPSIKTFGTISHEDYEHDFMLMKNKLEAEKNTSHFHEEFAKMSPSAMLGINGFEEGPSFISFR